MRHFSARSLLPFATVFAGTPLKTSTAFIRTPGSNVPQGIIGQQQPGMPDTHEYTNMDQPPMRMHAAPGQMEGPMDPRMYKNMTSEDENAPPPPPAPKPSYEPRYFSYDISVDAKTKGLTTITLMREPVNSLNMEFLQELNDYLAWMGDEEGITALILTSAIPSVFSAGLDINEMAVGKDVQKMQERFPQFWILFQQLFFKLNTFPKPVVCAINGNSPAAGCVMALCCDYRIMLKHGITEAGSGAASPKLYRIGLNEIKLGLVAPPWVMLLYSHVMGSKRKAEKMLQLGETPTCEEAFKLGMIDEIIDPAGAKSSDECHRMLLGRAENVAQKYLSVASDDASNYGRWLVRDVLRNDVLSMLSEPEACEQDVAFFSQVIGSPDVQNRLEKYLERLSGKK